MLFFQSICQAMMQLAFPHVCEGCGTDVLDADHHLCLRCLDALPGTNYHMYPNNPIEKIFWGRLPLVSASAQYYFTKQSLIQHLMHELKYKGNRDLGRYLGRLMVQALASSNRFQSIDMVVPLPLHASKEKKRGYNQAAILCEGLTETWKRPVQKDLVYRLKATESQTKKNRLERWQNVEHLFALRDQAAVRGHHVLLVDDVITTGATLEACGRALLSEESCRLSIATLCFSGGN